MISKSAETTRSPLFEVTRVLARFHHDPMKIPTQFITAITQPATTSFLARPVILLLLSFSAGLASMQPCAATPFEWEYTGSLKTARFHHTATLLPDGRVLVVGGEQAHTPLASAELYDPATGTWSATGSLNTARDSHTATLLPSGKVLVAGGRETDPGPSLASAELYDPATGTWSPTGSLNTARLYHTATLLPNGKVLVAGGGETDLYSASAELYNPATGSWSPTGSFDTGRIFHTATLLANGKVLVTGGRDPRLVELASADLYNPATGTWSATGSLNTARYDHTATLLRNGMVLVAGGNPDELDSAELYDPATGTWSVTDSLNDGRADHVETLLPNGMVLVAGGTNFEIDTAELYDPATGTWSLTGSLNTMRKDHAATLLLNGMVLVTGGALAHKAALATAELYDPGIVVSGQGSIHGQGDEATFEFDAKQSDNRPTGSLSFSDPAAGISITKAKLRTLTFNGNSADLGGTARLGDGRRVTYSVTAIDNSSDGSTDTFSITLSNGYSASGTLLTGDIRIH